VPIHHAHEPCRDRETEWRFRDELSSHFIGRDTSRNGCGGNVPALRLLPRAHDCGLYRSSGRINVLQVCDRHCSKVKLRAELEHARIPSRCNLPEITVRKSSAHNVELGMIERVEALEAKLEAAPARFTENETLKQRQVPIVPTRAADGTLAQAAPVTNCGYAQISFTCARGVRRVIEPACHGLWIMNRTNRVRSIGCVRYTVVPLLPAQSDMQRQTGFGRDDSGQLPAAERHLERAA
jgi:hypothetical protein